MTRWDDVQRTLPHEPHTWLVTGAAGFIGSHLVDRLLALGQRVVGVDNLATGHLRNLDDARAHPGFRFMRGDINDAGLLDEALRDVRYVLHQAALGSVPRSLADPLATHRANVDGFFAMLLAARTHGVARVVYASSSSVYGDDDSAIKHEDRIGHALSPYAASKRIDELYADVVQRCYGLPCVGLRYFNVFGPRQDPHGPYAAVIPRWIDALRTGAPCTIHGDGETSRDFCYVDNVVQANLLAALGPSESTGVCNVACGERTTLRTLHALLREAVLPLSAKAAASTLTIGPFREGDIRHSLADVARAQRLLGYAPTHDVRRGVVQTAHWFVAHAATAASVRSE